VVEFEADDDFDILEHVTQIGLTIGFWSLEAISSHDASGLISQEVRPLCGLHKEKCPAVKGEARKVCFFANVETIAWLKPASLAGSALRFRWPV
jgi:hypothetical protein